MKEFDFSDFDQEQFESADRFEQNTANQKLLSKEVLSLIQQEGEENIPFILDFFFCTNSEEKANALEKDLLKRAYLVDVCALEGSLWTVTGTTGGVLLKEGVIEQWIEEMCEVGYRNDCRFDGWGTGDGSDE